MNDKQNYTTDVVVRELLCQRCNHKWLPRKVDIESVTCPNCHSA